MRAPARPPMRPRPEPGSASAGQGALGSRPRGGRRGVWLWLLLVALWPVAAGASGVGQTLALRALTARLQIPEARLARHPFMMGQDLTLADIHFGNILYRYFTLGGIERADLPAVRAYYDRLCTRPAYAEHVMVPYDALRPAA